MTVATNPEIKESAKEPDSLIGAGVAIGLSVGIGLGAAIDNVGLGIALGMSFGAALGAAIDHRRRNRDRSTD